MPGKSLLLLNRSSSFESVFSDYAEPVDAIPGGRDHAYERLESVKKDIKNISGGLNRLGFREFTVDDKKGEFTHLPAILLCMVLPNVLGSQVSILEFFSAMLAPVFLQLQVNDFCVVFH